MDCPIRQKLIQTSHTQIKKRNILEDLNPKFHYLFILECLSSHYVVESVCIRQTSYYSFRYQTGRCGKLEKYGVILVFASEENIRSNKLARILSALNSWKKESSFVVIKIAA